MNPWEEQLIFLNYLERICGIYWGIIDDKMNVLEKFIDTKELNFESLWVDMINNEAKSDVPKIYSVGKNINM